MSLLKKELEKLIPEAQQDIKSLISKNGESQISTVSVAQAFSGLRGIKAFVCDTCLLYTSPSPRDATLSRMPSSA